MGAKLMFRIGRQEAESGKRKAECLMPKAGSFPLRSFANNFAFFAVESIPEAES